jgi:hypothetical protein
VFECVSFQWKWIGKSGFYVVVLGKGAARHQVSPGLLQSLKLTSISCTSSSIVKRRPQRQ